MRMTPNYSYLSPGFFFQLNRAASLCGQPNLSMDVIQLPSFQPFQNRIHHNRPICNISRKFLTLQYTSPKTHLPLLSPLMPLSSILVLLLILVSLSPTISPTSPAPASCTFVTSAAYDPCLTLKLPPPLPPPLFILN